MYYGGAINDKYLCIKMLFLLVCLSGGCASFISDLEIDWGVRGGKKEDGPYLDETFFPSLSNYHVNAKRVSEKAYPWIARVIHSQGMDIPHVCSASCIKEKIFITAARCIYTLKVKFTKILYNNYRMPAKAFVVSSNPSKQLFDDIGFIIVQHTPYNGAWQKIALDTTKRTDEKFDWFKKLKSSGYTVVGYAVHKGIHRLPSPYLDYNLTELPVHIGLDLCEIIMGRYRIKAFRVPCYLSCTLIQFSNLDKECRPYHGAEGSAIIKTSKNVLIGVTTWGYPFLKYDLPVGFAYPNSREFYKDYECAKVIAQDGADDIEERGYYQKLCDKIKPKA